MNQQAHLKHSSGPLSFNTNVSFRQESSSCKNNTFYVKALLRSSHKSLRFLMSITSACLKSIFCFSIQFSYLPHNLCGQFAPRTMNCRTLPGLASCLNHCFISGFCHFTTKRVNLRTKCP